MKLKLLIALLTICFISSHLSAQEWKIFNSIDGNFSVLTPGLMLEKNAIITTGLGEFEVHTLYFNQKDTSGNFLYLINYYDMPKGMIPKDSSELALEFLLNSMDQAVTDVDGDLQYNNEIRFGEHPGLLWRSRSNKQVIKSRAYIINDRFYMLQVFSIPNKSLNNEVDKFLESFTLRSS